MGYLEDTANLTIKNRKQYANFASEIFDNRFIICRTINDIQAERDAAAIGDLLLNAYNTTTSISLEDSKKYREILESYEEVKEVNDKSLGVDKHYSSMLAIQSLLTTYWLFMNGICKRTNLKSWRRKPKDIKYTMSADLVKVSEACRNIMIHADDGKVFKYNIDNMKIVLAYFDEIGYDWSWSSEPEQIFNDFKNRVFNPKMWKIALWTFDILEMGKASNLRWKTSAYDLIFNEETK